MSADQLLFSVRIVSVDSYMCDPVPGLDICRSEFRKSDIKSVPVVRVFGSTPAGQTTCLHIHGVFPYLMVPYCGPDVTEAHWSEIEQYMQQMANGLDNALNSASGKSKSNRQHVFKIVMLRGIPFYGYHKEEELFLKIYFYLPGDIKRAAELLQSGMVMDRQFQPHEAHIPYILQLFLDYNLYGMNLLHAKNCWFRLPIGKPDPILELPTIKRPDDIPADRTRGQTGDGNTGNDNKKDEKLDEKIQMPTMSQLRNFNWNLLREKAQSTYSQKNQQNPNDEQEDLGDSDLPLTSATNIRRTSKDEDSQSNITQCSDLCKSLLSKTLLPTDSEEMVAQMTPPTICPLHALWSGQNVPPASKLPTEVERHSTCDLEVDAVAADISNRDELANASTSNPGIAAIWEDERARRRELAEESQIPVDQSQPRTIGENLSEREAHYIQMLYDALDRHQEENSLTSSYNDSLSFTVSQSTRRPSADSIPSRRESRDLFASSVESKTGSQKEDIGLSSPDSQTPKGSQDLTQRISQGGCSLDEDVSTLELMKRLEEEENTEFSIAAQRGNGPLDDDNEQLTPEDFVRSQNILKRQLSFSLSNSQYIESPSASPDDTQPLAPPSDDDDIEEFEMSQRWDSAIQDLLKDLSSEEILEDDQDDVIPQLDGASDEPAKGACIPTKRLGSTKRSCVVMLKSAITSSSSSEKAKEVAKIVNTVTADEKPSTDVNTQASKAPDDLKVTKNDVQALVAGSDATTSNDATASCTAVTTCDFDESTKLTEQLPNMQLKIDVNLPKGATSGKDSKILRENSKQLSTLPTESTVKSAGELEAGHDATATVEPVISSNSKSVSSSKTNKSGNSKDRSVTAKSRDIAKMVENFVLVESSESGVTKSADVSTTKEAMITEDTPTSSANEPKNDIIIQSTKSSNKKKVASKDTVLKRIEPTTNIFTTILNENPGVTLYDQTISKPQQYMHSAVINLNTLSPDKTGAISGLENTLIKITSTPVKDVAEINPENTRTRRAKTSKMKAETKATAPQPTRTRKPRLASKNSYLEDPLYETVFDSDWDSDESADLADVSNTSSSISTRPKRTPKKSSNDYKRKRKSKQKVITKWIIVNRFKGMSNMKIGLWKIPATKRVKLTPELIRLYELYSPTKSNIKFPPTRPPNLPPPAKPRPMGRRSKHMLAILCPFGPNFPKDQKATEKTAAQPKKEKINPVILAPANISARESFKDDVNMAGSLPPLSKDSQQSTGAGDTPRVSLGAELPEKGLPLLSLSKDCQQCTWVRDTPMVSLGAELPEKGLPSSENPSQEVVPKMDVAESSAENIVLDNEIESSTPSPEEEKLGKDKVDDSKKTQEAGEGSTKLCEDYAKNNAIPEKMALNHLPEDKNETPPMPMEFSSHPALEKILNAGLEKDSAPAPNLKGNKTEHQKGAKENKKSSSEKVRTKKNADLVAKSMAEKMIAQSTLKKIPKKHQDPEVCLDKISHPAEALPLSDGAEFVLKTHPILTSFFSKTTKQPIKKSEKKKSVKSKKKKSLAKLERNSPSPHDSDKDTKIMKSIVPVSSRTVEPLCNRVSPLLKTGDSITEKNAKSPENTPKMIDNNILGEMTPKKSTMSPDKSILSKNQESTPIMMPLIEKESPRAKGVQTVTTSPDKKPTTILLPSTKKVYSPSRKVTRNSVAVKLNSISAPKCMFTPLSDDSLDPWPPVHALMTIAFPSPHVERQKTPIELPRPWSPKITHVAPEPEQEQTEANDILEDFAESFGTDATKMLGLVDDSVFKNMDCIDQLINDNQPPDNQKDVTVKMDLPQNLKDDSEKMLKHFDKIFENVSSNAASTSKGSEICETASVNLDEFEEETLMEFIDEMTSPTVPLHSDSSAQANPSSMYPLPTNIPQIITDARKSNDTPTPQTMSPALRGSGSNTPALPLLPTLQPQRNASQSPLHPQRPASAYPQQQQQITPNFGYKSNFVPPIRQQQNQTQPWQTEPRPQSCYPGGQTISNPHQVQRPASTLGHWPGQTAQSQPCVYNDSQMQEIRKNMTSPNGLNNFGLKPGQDRTNCAYHNRPGVQTQPACTQVPPPYPQISGQFQFRLENQGYSDPGQVPRPSSVLDPPLQVFHTHVHHHHHVHSIDNQSSGSTSQGDFGTPPQQQYPQQQQQQVYPVVRNIKNEISACGVKIENAANTPWPSPSASGMVTPEQTKVIKPPEKAKSSKTQFYVPNSPFPFPKPSPVTPIHLGPQNLVQTISYVETSQSQSIVSGKSDFLTFAGIRPEPRKASDSFPSIMTTNIYSGISSVLLKGSCQIDRNFQGAETPARPASANPIGQKPAQRRRQQKNKRTWNPLPTLQSVAADIHQTPLAKTPYGLMKQNSLNAVKKRSKPSKVAERKRKTISDFRAPPGTPTISLTASSAEETSKPEAFELSQDMFEKSKNFSPDRTDEQKTYSSYSITEEKKKESEKEGGKRLKLTINKNTITKSSKNAKQRQKRSNTAPAMHHGRCHPNCRPIPQKGEELVLNPDTGNWEILPVDISQKYVPVVFAPEEQSIVKSQTSRLALEMHRAHSNKVSKIPVDPIADLLSKDLPTISRFDSVSSSEDIDDFAVAKKKKKRSKIPAEVKRASSTPEYMVSAVDFESSSPRLKLTLKKTPPSRGKPQLSTLVTASASDIENVIPKCPELEKSPKMGPFIIAPTDSSDDSDFARKTLKKRKKRIRKNIESGSDSDFRIEEITDSSTDEASEIGEAWSPGEIKPRSLDFQEHLDTVRNMYVLVERSNPLSVLVHLTETQIIEAIGVVRLAPPKRTIAPSLGRSKDGRFVSLAKVKQQLNEKQVLDVAPPPSKVLKIVPNIGPSFELPDSAPPPGRNSDPGKRRAASQKRFSSNNSSELIEQLVQKSYATVSPNKEEGTDERCQNDHKQPHTLEPKNRADPVVKAISCTGQSTDKNNNANTKNFPADTEKLTVPKQLGHESGNKSSKDDPNGGSDPPSPPDRKMQETQTHSQLVSPTYLYRTVLKPPSKSEVLNDVQHLRLETASTSKEPFYSDIADAQTTSHRLSNLPPYIKRPKARKSLADLSEYQSNLPLEGGIHHWTVLATASENRTAVENAVLCQKASEILPPNIHVWDHIDAVTKLPQYPALAKVFLESEGKSKEITLRPVVLPPSRKQVEEWLQQKRSEKKIPDIDIKKGHGCCETGIPLSEDKINPTPQSKSPLFPFTPSPGLGTLRRSISLTPSSSNVPTSNRRRRVSFDLSNLTQPDDTVSPILRNELRVKKRLSDAKAGPSKITKLEPIKGSPVKPIVAIATGHKIAEAEISPKSQQLPFANLTSPVTPSGAMPWDNTTSFVLSPPTLPSIQGTVTPEGSSSAIKTLVGSSDTDKTSPMTFLISGSFTPPPCSTQGPLSERRGEEVLSSLKKHPQSTPNIIGGRQRKHVLRKLAFTPIEKDDDRGVIITPAGTKSSLSPQQTKILSQQTPTSKTTSLRKRVLAKTFNPSEAAEKPTSPAPSLLSTKDDPAPSPVVLQTPRFGQRKDGSQIDGPTLDNTYGFKAAQQHLGEAKSLHIVQHITSVSLELHVKTRIDLRPDPDMDEIRCLFYCLDNDAWTGTSQGMRTGAIVVDPASITKNNTSVPLADEPSTSTAGIVSTELPDRELFKKSGVSRLDVIYVGTEMELFLVFAQLMHRWDPDILVGYEVQMLSWGFLLQRAAHLRCDLCRAISRIPTDEQRNRYSAERDAYGADNASELHIVGRIVLNLWRLMRTELALYDYSFESVAYHLLHERHPKYDHHTLTNWFDPPSRSGQQSHIHRYRVIDYYVARVRGNMKLLQQQDLVDRTSELARLFGIQFFDVLTRGSQFRVESMLLRTARAHNLVAVTPGVLQRAQMRAPEVIALVMEPESKFYHVPVLVLDFQSLYPSMVIAYNICFSTCLGRVELLGSDAFFTFGCTSLRVPAKILKELLRKNLIMINPSGVAFVKSSVRKGVMPQMLDEILTTRIMVKNSMKKLGPSESATKRMLDHRQLGLKLIANVTYGYTAANFSGRMPCVEVGDSIVHKARETLERSIHLVTRNSERWENARVVYGDTDSMFIALEGVNNTGCSKQRAFEIGKEIAAEVTADNPTPVKLKFEKVYLPCVLQTKKRYVGYSYETEDQKDPIFDAKGIETVRRDGTPATAKILEKMLKVLFDTRDVTKVKEYVLKQCSKILDARTTLQDCIIAKEYRGKQYYKPGAVVPALNIAKKLLALDKRAEPRVGERVPYVVVHGAPGTPLYQLVRSPLEVLKDQTLQLNGAYYVTKQVLPALDRVLSLLGVDVFLWHRLLPRTVHLSHNAIMDDSQNVNAKKATISQFFKSKHCLMCKKLSIQTLCDECLSTDNSRRQTTAVSLSLEANSLERQKHHIEQICMQCTGATSPSEVRCISLDCPILYKLHRAADEFSKTRVIRKALLNEDML